MGGARPLSAPPLSAPAGSCLERNPGRSTCHGMSIGVTPGHLGGFSSKDVKLGLHTRTVSGP